MITPARLDIEIYAGASFELVVTLQDSSGSPLNLVEREVLASIWDTSGKVELAQFAVNVLNGAQGRLTLNLSEEQTRALPIPRKATTIEGSEIGGWDLRIVEPGETVSSYWLKGLVTIYRGLS